jgi:hypothetical protein
LTLFKIETYLNSISLKKSIKKFENIIKSQSQFN